LIVFRAAQADRVDLGGCYVPNVAKGVTESLPLELLHKLRTATVPTLLFLDDLGQAPIDVQASAMALFDDNAISKHVLIWGATNRPSDKAGVTSLNEALRSRFHVAFSIATPTTDDKADGPTYLATWREEVDAWAAWAGEQGFAPELIAWHRSTTGRTLYAWKPCADPALRMPDFRSWETVGHLWEAGLRGFKVISAAIGKPAAAEFLAFAALADQLPTPQQVWMDPHGAPVPTEPAAQYLIAAMLGRAVEAKYASQLVVYIGRLPRVMGAYCAKDAFSRLGAKLVGNAEWQKWWVANQALFTT
tara:strand:+ start:1440 stop:2351 length:912 start_codon:yes stop_codon:yes gene_type:complete